MPTNPTDNNPFGYVVSETLDDFYAYTQPSGSHLQAAGDALYGINQTRTTGAIPMTRETMGYVFFTRPVLNLSSPNLVNMGKMLPLLTDNANSVHRYVRCTLDPSLSIPGVSKGGDGNPISCPLVDPLQAFIPLLSNSLLKLSGWPDTIAPVYTSKQGLRKEQWSMVDGTTEVNQAFTMDATFMNYADKAVGVLFDKWVNYETGVFDGQLKPYTGYVARNEIDYTTRIYRLVMDKTNTFVTEIACTIASFPINEPTGKYFDFDKSAAYMDQNKNINIRFQCTGARYNEDKIVRWFNTTAGYGNPNLRAVVSSGFEIGKGHNYAPIAHSQLPKFKYRGYPLINPATMELQWWISMDSEIYKKVTKGVKATVANTVGVLLPTSTKATPDVPPAPGTAGTTQGPLIYPIKSTPTP